MAMMADEPDRRALLALAGVSGLARTVAGAGARDSAASPRVVVESVRRIFHNGEHNAFTDLARF